MGLWGSMVRGRVQVQQQIALIIIRVKAVPEGANPNGLTGDEKVGKGGNGNFV